MTCTKPVLHPPRRVSIQYAKLHELKSGQIKIAIEKIPTATTNIT